MGKVIKSTNSKQNKSKLKKAKKSKKTIKVKKKKGSANYQVKSKRKAKKKKSPIQKSFKGSKDIIIEDETEEIHRMATRFSIKKKKKQLNEANQRKFKVIEDSNSLEEETQTKAPYNKIASKNESSETKNYNLRKKTKV